MADALIILVVSTEDPSVPIMGHGHYRLLVHAWHFSGYSSVGNKNGDNWPTPLALVLWRHINKRVEPHCLTIFAWPFVFSLLCLPVNPPYRVYLSRDCINHGEHRLGFHGMWIASMSSVDCANKRLQTYRNVINNELSSTSTTRHSINPATSQPNPEVPVSTQQDVDLAVKSARDAFNKWSKTSFAERRAALAAYADAIEANADAFAKTLTMEQGKPLDQSATEVGMASIWIRGLSAIEIPENVLEETDERKIIQRYLPLGVSGAIVPWNFPILLAIGKIVPAVYTGNTVIVKPSPFTPYCGLKLAELATKFFPPGVIQCLSGDDSLGPMVTEHPGVDKISFTGSTLTGKRVMASCAKTLKRVTLELGGNDPAIICDDVDIDAIIPQVSDKPRSEISHRDAC